MKARVIVTGAMLMFAGPSLAEMQVQAMRYTCERGVEVPAVYVNDDVSPGVAVISVEGGMYNLLSEEAASGVRYGYPSGGSHYIWWTKGDTATLLWHDGTDGSENVLLESCIKQ